MSGWFQWLGVEALINGFNFNYIPSFTALYPCESDIVVPAASQCNGLPNAVVCFRHIHGDYTSQYELHGETNSPIMVDQVRRLLSSPLDDVLLPANGIHFPNARLVDFSRSGLGANP